MQSQDFWTDVKNTLVYAVLYAPIVVIIALAFALLLNRKDLKFVGFFRTCMFLPFRHLADRRRDRMAVHPLPVPRSHPVLGLAARRDPCAPRPARYARNVDGHHRLHHRVEELRLLHGHLPRRPARHLRQLYEAASLDGASAWQKFRYITLPALRPTFNYVVIFGLIGSFRSSIRFFILTSGGPARSTETIVYRIYTEAFGNGKLGYASALSYVLLIMTSSSASSSCTPTTSMRRRRSHEHRNRNLHETDRGTGIRKTLASTPKTNVCASGRAPSAPSA